MHDILLSWLPLTKIPCASSPLIYVVMIFFIQCFHTGNKVFWIWLFTIPYIIKGLYSRPVHNFTSISITEGHDTWCTVLLFFNSYESPFEPHPHTCTLLQLSKRSRTNDSWKVKRMSRGTKSLVHLMAIL